MLNSTYLNSDNLPHKPRDVTVNEAVAAWRTWSPEQRASFGEGAGVAEIWDFAIVPLVTNPSVVRLAPAGVSALRKEA